MQKISFSLSLVIVSTIIGCAKHPITEGIKPPEAVNAAQVKTILTVSKDKIAECASDLKSSGASIIYQNQRGLLMTDKAAAELDLGSCEATVTPNENTFTPPTADRKNEAPIDLPTLMKLIPAEEIGARSFIDGHPERDGRGARVAILDTGVELDHPMLTVTSAGEHKVVDFADFSGAGRVEMAVAQADSHYQFHSIPGSDFKMGIFLGSSLQFSEDVAKADVFQDLGVISYLNADGQRRARIDLNDNKDFSDDEELYDFEASRKFVKLGKKKTLTTNLNILEDGKVVSLCFDDGSHGTHVAGIAAGFDPKGLSGVAPGAQVIAAKIGDSRLSGGSTTTASMLLAIDYAVQKEAHIVNLSYGIRAGSNLGKSTIDQYVDKIAKEAGILFAISAGNEGPGLLTIGTPAGANLAISNAAYVSKQTARENYGYLGVEDDNTWFFSSVGPRLDGGWKPTLLAPGSAISSVPLWEKTYQNFRGTSMASPQVTGGLALIVGAALHEKLPVDRAAITRAVYRSARPLSNLLRIEQGHGLMNVPNAVAYLRANKDRLPTEYTLSVASPTSPDGKGQGIYIRSGKPTAGVFTVSVTPDFPKGTTDAVKDELNTFRLVPSASWIHAAPTFWLGSYSRTLQVAIDPSVFDKPGLYSEVIDAIDEKSGQIAFQIPVTIVSPAKVDAQETFALDTPIRVGQTLRYFIDVPAGMTAAHLDVVSDGPVVWAQLLDSEGTKVAEVREADPAPPMNPQAAQANLLRPGVYELDLIAPPYNPRHAQVHAKIKLYSLKVTKGDSLGANATEILVQNNGSALKMMSRFVVKSKLREQIVPVSGNIADVNFEVAQTDIEQFQAISFRIKTAKAFYDLMTDYPFRLFDPANHPIQAGGLEPVGDLELSLMPDTALGKYRLEVQGAFTKPTKQDWSFTITERRMLALPIALGPSLGNLLEPGQEISLKLDESRLTAALDSTLTPCPSLILETRSGRVIQENELCMLK